MKKLPYCIRILNAQLIHGLYKICTLYIITGAKSTPHKQINRKRKETIIELKMFGGKIEVSVGLEVAEKV